MSFGSTHRSGRNGSRRAAATAVTRGVPDFEAVAGREPAGVKFGECVRHEFDLVGAEQPGGDAEGEVSVGTAGRSMRSLVEVNVAQEQA